MATTTPNFGWSVPTSSDLVKNGAVAIETLGDSIDASLVDLKGGTTGQVLSKTSNTDMDFTWVAQDDSNAIQNAIVDAKGDLIGATANDTPARLAVGTNEAYLKADSTTATGLKWDYDSWTSYTPTIAAVSGSFTTASATGRYKQIGKTIFVQVKGTITTVGTGSGCTITVPFTAANQGQDYTGAGRNSNNGDGLQVLIQANSNLIRVFTYANGNVAASGNILSCGITYEIA